MRILFTFIFYSIAINALAQNSIVINEFMSDNTKGISGDTAQCYDWIELYNPSEKRVNLEGFGISDDPMAPFKYVFPKVNIKPNSYLVVYASGQNYKDKKQIHLNFKINRFGEPLLLASPNGKIIDSMAAIPLVKNSSYGRTVDGQRMFERFTSPTPNGSNNLVEGLVFSHEQGFYSSKIRLEIESKLSHEVRYTLDGSQPNAQSQLYNGPIEIENLTSDSAGLAYIKSSPIKIKVQENYFKGTILRAATFNDNEIASQVYTKTYFVTDSARQRFANIDVISLVTDQNNLFSTDTGIYIGGVPKKFRASNANYFKRGMDWERSAHITFFDSNGSIGFEQGIGIRIHGGRGRKNPQKSFRLCARKEYGAQAINYPLFDMRKHRVFKKVVLRNSMGCWYKTLIKDEVAAEMCKDLNVDVLDARPVILFINGEYWGIYAIRENFDPDYIASNYKVKAKDVNIILHGYGNRIVAKTNNWGLIDGNGQTHADLYQFLRDHSLAKEDEYAKIGQYLDIESIIDYYCIQIYFNNRDWPTNNNKLWSVGDGPWRQVLYDIDGGWSTKSNNLTSLMHGNEKKADHYNIYGRFLFLQLAESPIFVEAFARRMNDLMQNEFSEEYVTGIVEAKKVIYGLHIQENINRWGYPKSLRSWNTCINGLIAFNRNRPKAIQQAFIDNFNISLDSLARTN